MINWQWGASLAALTHVANSKGYSLVGCSSYGANAFYVRRDLLNNKIKEKTVAEGYVYSNFRDSRDQNGALSYLGGEARYAAIKGMEVLNVVTKDIERL
ncbi:MAG: hypothetical protein LBV33_04725 [Lachnospiraceae bacterium]|jgi:hypothetical protein|nr:hypothetical protein [Lachnospiraceae bacterium]